ncbi:aminotransferase class I/II-fold pyridoxal phosphate-dependent enzyme [Nocardia sp. CDC153]|uniref:aminotransferase class I/II-fold pyridoxal phosphate-dependent enzyme n=1 Tax=Nocardia sp. CDC153 TaxID=3112167 RepID=UPI002DB8BBAF|nr:aminotransferase class I/II-fold pyridoxal phosphate-dependent enzyme [Nocardia sp. CDC153]MEC3956798.1 aminotransferase class I/II-fold pyridoxal phosphate-dependent enzyme [Nocardia sp. CDC153]
MNERTTALDPVEVADRSDERKKLARGFLSPESLFPGRDARTYRGIIDAYHGETGLAMDESAAAALNSAWSEVMSGHTSVIGGANSGDYRDVSLYNKRQPMILRQLAAEQLFQRISAPVAGMPGLRVDPDDVLVCPYSSTVLLEEAIATIARPGGVLVCPEGYYKSVAGHITKFGLRLVTSPVTADQGFRIDPVALARTLEEHARQGNLCGVLLTLPGNPVVADYTVEELVEIGRVLLAADVPVICDMSFDLLVEGHTPIAAITVPTADGPVRLYDRVLSITGNSKAYNAFGPCKIGAVCCGDREWLDEIRGRLRVSFQRETTHLARATIERTRAEYLADNRKLLRAQVDAAHRLLADINARFGRELVRPLGSRDGMFVTVEFDEAVMAAAGVRSSADLEDLLLMAAGVDCVALDRTGSRRMGVRLNVSTPRRGTGEVSPGLLAELFDRIERLLERIDSGLTYAGALLELGIPARESRVVTVGVLRETVADERRVAATPDDVARLVGQGLQVVVEQGAGWRADFTDAAYAAAGASVVAGPAAVFDTADLVMWVKPPAYDLDSMPMRPGQLLLGFQDPIARQDRIRTLSERGVESVAFERIPSGSRAAHPDPLSAMSRIAGGIAYREGRERLRAADPAAPVRALVLGCGTAGLAALAAAAACGDQPPTAVGSRVEQKDDAYARGATEFLLDPDPAALAEHIADVRPNLVICAAGQRGARAPVLLDQRGLDALPPGAVVVDLTAKAGGNCVRTRANDTVTLPENITVTHRSNFPASHPHVASVAYGAAACAAILLLAAISVG